MIYKEDLEFKYEAELGKLLREYNLKFTGEKESSSEYFYILEEKKLVGAVHTKYFWDWVGIGNIFYNNINTLETLLSRVCDYYKNKAVGIKIFTEVKSRVEDFKSVGFDIAGKTEISPKTTQTYYLKHTDFSIKSNMNIEVIVSCEKIDKYDAILLKEIENFKIDKKICPLEETDIMFVALDDNKFIAGVCGCITEDTMYISRLAVDEVYRGKNIGRTLMEKIEKKAKSLNVFSVNLGTIEFQAKDFYRKLGYQVVFTKENDPKGYKSFSMVKKI